MMPTMHLKLNHRHQCLSANQTLDVGTLESMFLGMDIKLFLRFECHLTQDTDIALPDLAVGQLMLSKNAGSRKYSVTDVAFLVPIVEVYLHVFIHFSTVLEGLTAVQT